MTTIKLKNGSGAPTSGDLAQGEPALDLTNKRLYTEDSGGNVIEVGTNPGTDVTFADNRKAIFGAGSDLQIYHDGSNSYIDDAGTGNLFVRASDNFYVQNASGTETKAAFTTDGAVKLYYNGGTKFQTVSGGIDVTGSVVSDGLTVDTNTLYVDATNNRVGIGTSSPVSILTAVSGASADETVLTIANDYSTADTAGDASGLMFQLYRSYASSLNDAAFIKAEKEQAWDASGERDSALTFGTRSGATEPTEAMRIDSNGNVGIGESNPATDLHITNSGSTQLLLESGSSSQGFLLFGDASDLNVGSVSYNHSDNSMSFETDDTERMRIDSSGNVGIGTSSPSNSAKLDAAGAIIATDSSLSTFNADNVGFDYVIASKQGRFFATSTNTTGGIMTFTTGQNASYAERMRIDSAGRVGIGTSSPATNLHVNSGANGEILRIQGADAQLRINNSTSNVMDINSSGSGDSLTLSTNDTERMRIDSSGNVGIGTSSPASKLDINGDGTILRLDGTANTSRTLLLRNVGGSAEGVIQTDGNMHFLQEDASKYMRFSTANTERMRIDSSGNVGIGESNPATDLHITNSGSTQLLLESGSSSQGFLLFGDASDLNVGSVSYNHSNNSMSFETDDTERMRIDSTGRLGLGTNAPDVKLDIVDTAADVQMRVYKFDGTNNTRLTLTADDSGAKIHYRDATNGGALRFNNNAGEMARFDASGNLLVGKTSAGSDTVGFQVLSTGKIAATVSGDETARFNRTTSDGDIVEFRKDDTTVGSIGAVSSDLEIHSTVSGHVGIRFGNGAIFPTNNSGVVTNGAANIGADTLRWKDLHLSGDVALTNSYVFGNVDGLNLRANSGKVISMQIAGSEKARLDASGNLLVGKSNQNTTNNGHLIYNSGEHYLFRNGAGSTAMMRFYRNVDTTPTIAGTISTTGTTTTYNTSSDQRLKDNIVDAPSASDDIDAIQVRSFDWKADGSHQKYGMVAQELQTVAPEAVSEGETEEDMMGVDYSKLVPMMLKEIQSLRARVAQLEGEA